MNNLEIIRVSIPHRYDRNIYMFLVPLNLKKVSIPHRYDRNMNVGKNKVTEWTFQFLIGTIETGLPPHLPFECLQVSIPHRYDRNLGSDMKSPRLVGQSFNSS